MILNIGTRTGKTYKIEIGQEKIIYIKGKKIGDEIEGDPFGLPGYVLKLTGGSDNSGFPMRPDVHGSGKKKVLLSSPPGFWPSREGERRRKTVRGNTYSEEIVQVNAVITKEGSIPLDQLFSNKENKEEGE